MSRRKIVAANWKMNLNPREGEHLVDQIIYGLPEDLNCEVVVAPPFIHLTGLRKKTEGTPIHIAAQHCHFEPAGAFTGEISVGMLKSIDVEYVITGHSERRQIFLESNEMIKSKVNAILSAEMIPVFCCGESLDIRQSGQQNEFVRGQLEESIFHLEPQSFSKLVIAYEPIWAIGTGVTASPQQAQDMHAFIRETISARYGSEISDNTRILYGGSIKADNAFTLFSQPDVDGGLVGGASLVASGFIEIIKAACG
jgi:triosephosphate isomerase